MKILHISTFDSGGAGLCCIRLHSGLLENGYQSKVLVMRKVFDYPEVYEFERNVIKLPKLVRWPIKFLKLVLQKLRFPTSQFQYLQFKLDKLRALSSPTYSLPLSDYDLSDHSLVREADLIHLHWTAGFLDWPSFFSKNFKPVIWTIHDENLYYGGFHYSKEHNINISVYQKLEEKLIEIKQKSIQQCKNLTIVSLSKMMFELSLSERIVKDRAHYIIHNSVNHNVFKPFSREFSRKVFNLPENKILLIFISYYLNDKNKGFKELILAMNELSLSEVGLITVGIGKVDIATPVEIYYLGAINDQRLLSLAYSAANICIMPSFQEGFAQTPLEAMACGLPVVTFPCSGTEELINLENGIRGTDFSVASLKDSIIRALNIQYNSEWIRQEVIRRFGIKTIISKYAEVYSKAINNQ